MYLGEQLTFKKSGVLGGRFRRFKVAKIIFVLPGLGHFYFVLDTSLHSVAFQNLGRVAQATQTHQAGGQS